MVDLTWLLQKCGFDNRLHPLLDIKKAVGIPAAGRQPINGLNRKFFRRRPHGQRYLPGADTADAVFQILRPNREEPIHFGLVDRRFAQHLFQLYFRLFGIGVHQIGKYTATRRTEKIKASFFILPPQIGNDKIGISVKIGRQFARLGNIRNITLAKEVDVHRLGYQSGGETCQIGSFYVSGQIVANQQHPGTVSDIDAVQRIVNDF